MPFRIPTTRVQLLRVLSAKADVSQVKAAAVWDAMLALARDGVRTRGSFPFPGLGKLERITRKARRGYNPVTRRRVKLPEKEDLVFRVSKIAKDAILARRPAPAAADSAPSRHSAPKSGTAAPAPAPRPKHRPGRRPEA